MEKVFLDEFHNVSDLKSIEQKVNDLCNEISQDETPSIKLDIDKWKRRTETDMELKNPQNKKDETDLEFSNMSVSEYRDFIDHKFRPRKNP